MNGKERRWLIAAATVILVLGVLAASLHIYIAFQKPSVAEAGIGAKGGVVEKFGVKATVPPGTIANTTELRITEPKQIETKNAPLGVASVVFDISFADGSQPSMESPLALEVPLTDALLPAGANPKDALFYHKLPNNGGYRLYPFTVNDGILRADLVHLSEWAIAYLGIEEAERMFGVKPNTPTKGSCATTAELSAGVKVKLIAKNDGNHINACLSAEDGKATLRVKNAVDYMWPFRVSSGKYAQPDGNAEQKMVAMLAGLIHPQGVKDYLPSSQELDVQLGDVAKASTVTLEASYNTWIADAVWRSLKVSVGLYFGIDSKGADELVGLMLSNADALVSCISAPLQRAAGKDLFTALSSVPTIIIEECGEVLEALANEFTQKVIGSITPWAKIQAVGQAAWVVLEQSFRLYVTVTNTLKGDVKFTVERVAPPKPPCATSTSFKEAIERRNLTVTRVNDIVCSSGWAHAITYTNPEYGQFDATLNLIRYQDGKWVHVRTMNEPIFYGYPGDEKVVKLCAELPKAMKGLCVKN